MEGFHEVIGIFIFLTFLETFYQSSINNTDRVFKRELARMILTAHQRSCEKIMFSVASVVLFVGRVPCDHDPRCIRTHHTGTPGLLLLGPHCTGTLSPSPSLLSLPSPPHPLARPLDMSKLVQLGTHCTGTPLTCCNLFIMKYAPLPSGRLASYRNAFLFTTCR